jgi:uncharacterized protein YciI
MKYVLFYESAPDVLEKAPLHMPAHHAYWTDFRRFGTMLMLGPFGNPEEGALGVFTTREAAETFAAGDPFVLEGVVKRWYVRDWHEVVT